MYYASPKHKKIYCNIICGKSYTSETLAVLYLLTADRRLWKKWRLTISKQGIDWTAGKSTEPGWDCYFLERAAKTIAGEDGKQGGRNVLGEYFPQDSSQRPGPPAVTLHDLLDYRDYPHEMFRLVVTALVIARCEPKVTREILVKRGLITA
jgi:hypothetical protein